MYYCELESIVHVSLHCKGCIVFCILIFLFAHSPTASKAFVFSRWAFLLLVLPSFDSDNALQEEIFDANAWWGWRAWSCRVCRCLWLGLWHFIICRHRDLNIQQYPAIISTLTVIWDMDSSLTDVKPGLGCAVWDTAVAQGPDGKFSAVFLAGQNCAGGDRVITWGPRGASLLVIASARGCGGAWPSSMVAQQSVGFCDHPVWTARINTSAFKLTLQFPISNTAFGLDGTSSFRILSLVTWECHCSFVLHCLFTSPKTTLSSGWRIWVWWEGSLSIPPCSVSPLRHLFPPLQSCFATCSCCLSLTGLCLLPDLWCSLLRLHCRYFQDFSDHFLFEEDKPAFENGWVRCDFCPCLWELL